MEIMFQFILVYFFDFKTNISFIVMEYIQIVLASTLKLIIRRLFC